MAKKRRRPQPGPPQPLPATVAEAVAFLQARADPETIAELRGTPFSELIRLHHGLGTQVRNLLGLWGGNPALIGSLPEALRWPDDASMYLIEVWWHQLQETGPDPARGGDAGGA